ncbi:UDP-N-acetylmuramate dehydrogenase [Stackebrandtia nassauensis]|uniref:UDP-N-acetylenolpyruvoylglucosamine reductase n=1 Tax=Stackebrandtia nassauensis (strain DSM 44728 / CIP 108903 / NRRL B-16338 / NBRC 102104 / LLR-40K-21) TaxID=446470 RepID=D3PX45_STANL|nr:UDP-N-acetylmuramate dehydrogenase [Stackebrandtia nassauensis]ADD45269.1 UDP-N-acetylenolpyruvoylglucosamine reductase [Stackebrandtia nassauensis DSM 44728]
MSDANLTPLATLTTLRLGGPAKRLVEAADARELVDVVRTADSANEPVLLVAGGSNLVIGDAGFDGTAVVIRSSGAEVAVDGDDVLVTVAAGHNWDSLVERAVAEGWSGIECLSGIPGSAGATPIQNVGAYGQEVAETIETVTVYDRELGETVVFTAADCRFAYRDSVFKHSDRFLVLDVRYRLRRSRRSAPIRYAETARTLGIEAGETVDATVARETVLKLRRGKGMVLDAADHDTYSAGSFFINPVVEPDVIDVIAAKAGKPPPNWPAGDKVKTSAAWLIAQAGFEKGYGHDGVSISTKHTLALTNRGDGTTAALLRLADEVRAGVEAAFGVRLRPEPTLVGTDWV